MSPPAAITILVEGNSDFAWEYQTADSIHESKLSQRFCAELALNPCSLKLITTKQGSSSKQADLQPGDYVTPGSELTALVDTSLGFHVWHCFDLAQVSDDLAVSEAWADAVRSYESPQVLDTSENTARPPLADFVHLAPLCAVPTDKLKLTADMLTASDDSAIGTCLSLLTTLLQTHRTLDKQSAAHVTSHPQQWASDSKRVGARLATLRQLVWLLKLATLLGSIRYHSPRAHSAQRVLWRTLELISHDLASSVADVRQGPEQEEQTCVLLVEMLVPLLRQTVNLELAKKFSSSDGFGVLQLVLCLLTPHSPVAAVSRSVGAAMLDQGALPILVAMLGNPAECSRYAVAALTTVTKLLDCGLSQPQVLEAEQMLHRLQAHHRLSNLLCPAFPDDQEQHPVRQEYEVFDPAWGKQLPVGRNSLSRCNIAQLAASLILRLLKHDPPLPTDPVQAHIPTPSPAQWVAIQASASKALVALHWSRCYPQDATLDANGRSLYESQLVVIADTLLVGHLFNLDLNVQHVLKLISIAILADRDPLGEGRTAVRLATGGLGRLGHNSQELRLQPRAVQLQQSGHHQDHHCVGCNKCCGPDWRWKTEAVSALLVHFCQYATNGRPTEAAMMVEALYFALKDHQQRQTLLRGAQKMPGDHVPPIKAIHDAIKCFDRDDGPQLMAQLTAIACLLMICAVEAIHDKDPDWVEIGTQPCLAWCKTARDKGTFELVIDSFRHAFQVPLPWSLEHSSALTRALTGYSSLQAELPEMLPIKARPTLCAAHL